MTCASFNSRKYTKLDLFLHHVCAYLSVHYTFEKKKNQINRCLFKDHFFTDTNKINKLFKKNFYMKFLSKNDQSCKLMIYTFYFVKRPKHV